MDQLEEIKSKIDIIDLISQHITLKKAGRNFKALCPFHKEKTPSFVVSPERQIFKCFGCNSGGDVFKFMMLFNGLDFGEAVRELAKRAGVTLRRFRPSHDYEEKERLLAINHLAAEYYHYILIGHETGKKALTYLLKRGIRKKTIEEFGLGYAPDSWESLLAFLIDKKKYTLDELVKVGLVIRTGRGRGGYARFRGRMIFPLKDLQGNVVGFSGRVLKDTEESKGAKYINTPETLLYHKSKLLYSISHVKEAIRQKKTAILVEGEFDVLSSWQTGIKNIVAIKGSALTPDQAKRLSRFVETLTFCLDTDAAGDEATRRGIEVAEGVGLHLNVIRLSSGKDVDELVQKNPKKWREAIKKPISIYDFYLKSALERFDVKTPLGKRKISVEMVPLLAKIGNEVIKAHFVKKTAKSLGVSEEAVFEEIRKYVKTGQIKVKPQQTEDKRSIWDKLSRQEKLEYYFLSLIIQSDSPDIFLKRVNFEILQNKGILKIFEKLKRAVSRKGFNMVKWAKGLPGELAEIFDLAFLVEIPDFSDEKREKEIEKVVDALEKIKLRARLTRLRERLRKAEEERKEKKIKRLSREISEILGKM